MRKVLLVITVILSMTTSHAQFTKGQLQATGLTCAMCSNAINKALQAVPFVESVRSDIKNSAFNIVFKTGNAISIDELKNAVEDAGFSIGSLKLTGVFDEMKIGKDEHVKMGDTYFHFLETDQQVFGGEKTITVVDKDFLSAKQFKKLSAATKMACVQTGKTASCCSKEGIPTGSRVYHVTI